MLPYINIFHHTITSYSLFILAGILVAVIFLLLTYKKSNLSKDDCIFCFLYSLIGALIGAKLLYLITAIPMIIQDFDLLYQNISLFLAKYIYGGFVFYGGLIGAFFGAVVYSKKFNIPISNFIFPLLLAIPLIHGFGRIGCFMTGCCYGIPTDSTLGVTFTDSLIAPNNISLIPIQIIEAVGLFLIFLILLIMAIKKNKNPLLLTAIYCLSYSLLRFIIEFFRGDTYRGFLGILSYSQYLSILLFLIGIHFLIKYFKSKKAHS